MSLWLDSRLLHGRRQGWKRREIGRREVDVHARWKPERRRDEDRAVDQKQLANEYWSISTVCVL